MPCRLVFLYTVPKLRTKMLDQRCEKMLDQRCDRFSYMYVNHDCHIFISEFGMQKYKYPVEAVLKPTANVRSYLPSSNPVWSALFRR